LSKEILPPSSFLVGLGVIFKYFNVVIPALRLAIKNVGQHSNHTKRISTFFLKHLLAEYLQKMKFIRYTIIGDPLTPHNVKILEIGSVRTKIPLYEIIGDHGL